MWEKIDEQPRRNERQGACLKQNEFKNNFNGGPGIAKIDCMGRSYEIR